MRISSERMGIRKIIFLLTAVSISTLTVLQWRFHTFAELVNQNQIGTEVRDKQGDGATTELIIQRLKGDQENNRKVIESLQHQIKDLQQLLNDKKVQLDNVEKISQNDVTGSEKKVFHTEVLPDADTISRYMRNQVDNAYVLKPHQYRNEYDITPFNTFTSNSVFKLNLELTRQPEAVLSFHKDAQEDLLEVMEVGVKVVNEGNGHTKDVKFVEGSYRIQYQAGMHYELLYQSSSNKSAPLHMVTLFRPFGPINVISSETKPAVETVHFIVPLQGRGDTFRKFMENFKEMAIKGDGHVHLTIVCYGKEAVGEAQSLLEQVEKEMNFKSYEVVSGDGGKFARGRALHKGTQSLPGDNPLMFFCDVDINFSTKFLSECRANTKPGKKVFYPVVFSLYNPDVVYSGKKIPPLKDQQVIRTTNGFWRDFGFGMACQYRKDFNAIGGFDLTIQGWGSEDVLLYRKYTRSRNYQVIRSPVNTLFHHWHPKHCDKSLSLEQYNSCLRSRSANEGSQIQLGMLLLKNKN